MEEIAYSNEGETYIVDVSPTETLDVETRKILVQQFKTKGLTDPQISKRLEDIAVMVMDAEIAQGHPDSYIRQIAKNSDLTPEDKEEIYNMTQQVGLPYLNSSQIFDNENPYYSREDKDAHSLKLEFLGMHEVTLEGLASGFFLEESPLTESDIN